MTALVTGGGGFLGTAIVKALRARGEPVRTLARAAYPHLRALGVETERGDIADRTAVRAAARGCDVIYHVAAKAGVWGPAQEYERTNVTGTENTLAACRELGIGRLVFTSSPSVVFAGDDESGVGEDRPYPSRYLAHYPRTKAQAERLVLDAASDRLRAVALRPHLIWGPGDPHLVPRIIGRARRGSLRLVGNGTNRIDSTYIDNAACAHLLAADRLLESSTPSGQAYFISNDEPVPIADLINGILAAAGLEPVRRQISPGLAYALGAALEAAHTALGRAEEPLMTRFVARQLSTEHWYDLTRAKRDLGYRPRVTLEEGLARLHQALGAHPGAREAKGRRALSVHER